MPSFSGPCPRRFSDILYMNPDQLPMVVELKPEQRTGLDSGTVSDPSRNIRIKGEL